MDLAAGLPQIICAILGASVGAIELANRYRDSLSVLFKPPGFFYMLINAGTAVLAYYAIQWFGIQVGATETEAAKKMFLEVSLASFGGMAVLRSSFFDVSVGKETVSVGPNALIQVLLRVTDREVDRLRAKARVRIAKDITNDLDFKKTIDPLPMIIAVLLQNIQEADRDDFTRGLEKLKAAKIEDRLKLVLLALHTMTLAGEDVLRTAINQLKSEFEKDPEPEDPEPGLEADVGVEDRSR